MFNILLQSNFTNWEEDELDEDSEDYYEQDDVEKCVQTRNHKQWRALSCSKSRRFICQLDEHYRNLFDMAGPLHEH